MLEMAQNETFSSTWGSKYWWGPALAEGTCVAVSVLFFRTRRVKSFDGSASIVWCLAGVPPRAAASLKSASCTDRRHRFPLIMRRNTIKDAGKRRRNETRTTCIIHLPTSPRCKKNTHTRSSGFRCSGWLTAISFFFLPRWRTVGGWAMIKTH